jgi:hypothetical protein
VASAMRYAPPVTHDPGQRIQIRRAMMRSTPTIVQIRPEPRMVWSFRCWGGVVAQIIPA